MSYVLTRIAAAVAMLQGFAHGAMFLRSKPTHGPDEVLVVEAMRSHVFNFAGALRSYWDMYTGYGLLAAGTCLVEGALLWMIAPLLRSPSPESRRILALVLLANLAHAAVILRYFFFVPLVPDLAVAGLLAAALWKHDSMIPKPALQAI